jgi:hypothetical protein
MTRRGAASDDPSSRRYARIAAGIIGVIFTGIGLLLGALVGAKGGLLLLFAAGTGTVSALVVRYVSHGFADGAARAVGAFLFPSGASSPYEPTFSAHDALEASGDVSGAIAAYDATLRESPGNPRVLRQAAELHWRAGDARRAAALLETLRRATPSREDELYATQRLADLHLGSLGDDGRALVELRRLVERFPGTREADGALVALRRLKDAREDGAPPSP